MSHVNKIGWSIWT